MGELKWGVPTQRTARKTEKFTTPVVTMSAIVKGSGRKMSFNKAAQEALGLIGGDSYVAIGFDEGRIGFQSSVDEVEGSFKLTKTCTFSNGKVVEYIAKIKGLNTDVENHLHLSIVEGQPYMEVSTISDDEPQMTVQDDAPVEEVALMEAGNAHTPEIEAIDEKQNESTAIVSEVEGDDVEAEENWG